MAVKLRAITFDRVDPQGPARFWSQVLGRDVGPSDFPGIATIGMGRDNPFYVFQKLDGLLAGRNRAHPESPIAVVHSPGGGSGGCDTARERSSRN